MSRRPAISFSPFQNASSRLTLVLWPATTMERLATCDFIAHHLPLRGPAADRILLMARNALFRNRRATVIRSILFCLAVSPYLPRFSPTGRRGLVPSPPCAHVCSINHRRHSVASRALTV